jgi:hypothetical protein
LIAIPLVTSHLMQLITQLIAGVIAGVHSFNSARI